MNPTDPQVPNTALPPVEIPDSRPDIVDNIPMHHAAAPDSRGEDELDKIMQDVGHQLKKEDIKPPKHHLFSRKPKPQKPVFHAQPQARVQIDQIKPPPQAPAAAHTPSQPPAATATSAKPVAAAKPTPKRQLPVLVIVMTVIVTGALIFATFSAYKN